MELTQNPIDMCVGVSQHAAGCAMAKHLLGKGYKRFAYLGSDHDIDLSAKKRFTGFNSVLKKQGLSVETVLTDRQISNIGLGKKLMQRLVDTDTAAAAIYFSNDSVAVGALLYCLANNIDVPGDFAMASFSGLDIALAMPVPLTTVSSPRRQMGLQGAKMLIDRIDGKVVKRVVNAGFKLVEGGTS
jgi:LacI family gluconate utilization system Gnt-I transcriptional repressor